MSRLRPLSLLAVTALFAVVPLGARASDDASFSRQWALPMAGVPAAWTSTTGAGVRIGIVDTGVDLTH